MEICNSCHSFQAAPEVFKREYTWTADIWSLGIILFLMLYGYHPFTVPSTVVADSEEGRRIIRSRVFEGFIHEQREGRGPWFNSAAVQQPTSGALDAITRMLQFEQLNRPRASFLLEFPFFSAGKAAAGS